MEASGLLTRWNLSSLEYETDVKKFKNQLSTIREKLLEIEKESNVAVLRHSEVLKLSQLISRIESAESFYYCLTTEDIEPSQLSSIIGIIFSLKSQVYTIVSNLEEQLNEMDAIQFEKWISNNKQMNFLTEFVNCREKCSNEQKIISNFSRETLSGLEDLYSQVRNNLKVEIDLGHEKKEVSFAEAMELALTHPEQHERLHVFTELNKNLEMQSNIFASIYNQMVGIRLHENKIKKIDCLDESLKLNGITGQTLNAMWNEVDDNMSGLSKYFKKKESGTKKISWHELMTSSQKVSLRITFPKAVEEIMNSLAAIDSNMSEFVKEALAKGWIDAEPRKAKSSGGFCAPFVQEGESRITLSYDDTLDSARRLAHELGHAWHFKQMQNNPSLQFRDDLLEMTMAETSSIFFETVFIDHMLQQAHEDSAKKAILGPKIERSLNYLMSIRGAYLFENEFYQYRKESPLDFRQIEELSLKCQEKAYGSSLHEYEPYVWTKYVQFYQASVPFYNYPYSFGFLFSIGLLEQAKEDEYFNLKFKGFLSETGKLPLEQLAINHFQIELSRPEFWKRAVQNVVQDIEQYNLLS